MLEVLILQAAVSEYLEKMGGSGTKQRRPFEWISALARFSLVLSLSPEAGL